MVASSPKSTDMESHTPSKSDDLVQAVKLLASGKRNTVMRNMSEAVSQLDKSCQLFVNTYGEKGQECGEVYLAYGTALLELARMESGVLGNALQGIKEDDEEAEDEEVPELDSSKLNADGDVKMTEEESEQLTENIVNAMTEEEREVKLQGEEETNANSSGDSKAKLKEKTDEEKSEKMDEKAEIGEDNDVKTDNAMDIDGDKTEKDLDEEVTKKDGNKDKDNGETNGETNGDTKIENEVTKESNEEKTNDENKIKNGVNDKELNDEKPKDGEKEGDNNEDEEASEEDIADEEEEDEEAEAAEDAPEEEDISNLQLAWEVLEVARNIYAANKDDENELKLSEVYNKLGELGIEGEQYSQAIEDFESSLVLQLKHFTKDDRRLAHTHYQLGIVYAFDKSHDKALSSMGKAIIGLNNRKEKLLENKNDTKEEDKIKCLDEELEEIKAILPDIESKIKDVEDDLKNMEELKKKIIESTNECGTSTGFGKQSETSKNDVVNKLVVRKKRKVSDVEDAVTDEKKQKPEEEKEK